LQPLNLASNTNSNVGNLVNSTYLRGAESKDAKGYQTAEQTKFHEEEHRFSESNKCSMFQFLTLYKGQGLGDEADGILGLAPQNSAVNKEKSYIWSLYNHNIISRPVLSFSLAQSDQNDQPYALFGGYNST